LATACRRIGTYLFLFDVVASSMVLTAGVAGPKKLALMDVFLLGGRELHRQVYIVNNASYVYEIYYCSNSSGSQNISRNILNTCL